MQVKNIGTIKDYIDSYSQPPDEKVLPEFMCVFKSG